MTESDKRCILFIKKKYKFIFPFQDETDRSSLQSSESRKARQNEPELKESQIFVHCLFLSTPHYIQKNKDLKILFPRGAREFKGGLCGLAALYWALTDTIYSPSQLTRSFTSHVQFQFVCFLRRMEHKDMTAAIEDIIESNSTEGDQVLLEQFSNCKSFFT